LLVPHLFTTYFKTVSPAHLTYISHPDEFGTHPTPGNGYFHQQRTKYITVAEADIEQYCIRFIKIICKGKTFNLIKKHIFYLFTKVLILARVTSNIIHVLPHEYIVLGLKKIPFLTIITNT
jgi:hypothetical protein